MKGERLSDGFHGQPPPGAYWKDEDGTWSVCTPNGRIGSLSQHTVTENEDNTITVSPSILVYPVPGHPYSDEQKEEMKEKHGLTDKDNWPGRPGWHGYLKNGVWQEV